MIEDLFQAVREAATTATWSRGVELARADAVDGEPGEGDEVVLRISTRGGLVSPTVTLSLDDGHWDCDCGTFEDACEHVVAAVLALRRARREGRALPRAREAPGRIAYRLAREGGGIALERAVVGPAGETPLASTLAALASGRVEGPAFVASQPDLAVEQALGPNRRGRVPRGVLPTLVSHLAGCPDVTLDGVAVSASAAPLGWKAVVEDEEPGFRLRVAREEPADEVFDGVVALCGGQLRPLAAGVLLGRELEDLSGEGRHVAPDGAAELASETLPALAARMPLELRTRRLPGTVREAPRIVLEVSRDGDSLCVLPTLVYGDPPLARVDAGRLVPLAGARLPLRDEAAERDCVQRLQRELGLVPGRRVSAAGGEAVDLAERMGRFRGSLRGDAHRSFYRAPALSAHFSASESGFALRFESEHGGTTRRADPARVLRAWREGESLVPLEGGGFAPLPADWLARFGERVADLLAGREAAQGVPPALRADVAALCAELDVPAPPSFEKLRRLLGNAEGWPHTALPADLRATLRGYQQRGVDWLCGLRDAGLGALLADDMGLGKTLQALCALRGRTLVVCPTSVLPNWQAEILRFRPALRPNVYHGPGRTLDTDADVTLTTWALLRLDADALTAVDWDTVILDEAQAIKNPDSQLARAAFRLRPRFPLALTGTPVENRLDELWSQLHFACRGLLGTRRDFDERVARPVAAGDEAAVAHLRTRIRPFVLRRRKGEVAPELPPRTDCVLHAELGEEERRLYDAILAATRRDVVERLRAGGSVLAALEALLRLRQAACHPALVPGSVAPTSSKLELLVESLDEVLAEGHKALVFSQWTSLLDLVEPRLREAGWRFARLDGSTRDRAGVVATFQDPQGPPVFLLSLTAGGVGLNLTAADFVFILDPWWNPAVEDQAADRAHRIGQEHPVMVNRLVARDTVEERILALQEKKRALAEAALGAGAAAESITREDLLALLA